MDVNHQPPRQGQYEQSCNDAVKVAWGESLAAGGFNLVCAKPNQKPDSAGRSRSEGRHGKSHIPSSACFRAEALLGVVGTKKHNIAVSGGRNGPIRGTTPRNSGQLSTNCVTGHWKISPLVGISRPEAMHLERHRGAICVSPPRTTLVGATESTNSKRIAFVSPTIQATDL